MGYGANQKTCYREALARGADIVVMVHPDYQYDPRLVTAMAGHGRLRHLRHGRSARASWAAARCAAACRCGNTWPTGCSRCSRTCCSARTCPNTTRGYRAYSRALLDALPWQRNSDDFVFDNQILAQAIVGGFRIGEVSVPTRYFAEASSIGFRRSVRYGFGVVGTTLLAFLARTGLYRHRAVRGARARRPDAPRPARFRHACPCAGSSAARRGSGILHWIHSFSLHVATGVIAVAAHYR